MPITYDVVYVFAHNKMRGRFATLSVVSRMPHNTHHLRYKDTRLSPLSCTLHSPYCITNVEYPTGRTEHFALRKA